MRDNKVGGQTPFVCLCRKPCNLKKNAFQKLLSFVAFLALNLKEEKRVGGNHLLWQHGNKKFIAFFKIALNYSKNFQKLLNAIVLM